MNEKEKKMSNNKTVQIGIRVTPGMKAAIQMIARKESRSLSQQILHFVKAGIQKSSEIEVRNQDE